MFFAYGFMGVLAFLVYFADEHSNEIVRVWSAGLFLVGLLFVIFLVKSFVDLEGAPRLLTLNLFIHYFQNPHMLESQGFKVIHQSQLKKYIDTRGEDKEFQWDELYLLSHEPDP